MDEHIKSIIERNKRVEMDKAWEVSFERRFILAVGTYIVVGGYLLTILNVESAWLHALVPPIAYIVSTLTLPIFKNIYLKKRFANENK